MSELKLYRTSSDHSREPQLLEARTESLEPLPQIGRWSYWWWTVGLTIAAALCLFVDLAATQALRNDGMPGDIQRILKLSEFFGHGFVVAVCLLGIWMLTPDKRRFIPRVALCALLPGIYVQGVKILFGRQRPMEFQYQELPDSIASTWQGVWPGGQWNMEYASQSFMSAHTATAFGLAIGLSWLFPRGRWLFLTLAFLAGIQRVAFEAHWLSDVFAGAAIAVMTAGAMKQNWGLGKLCGFIEQPVRDRHEQMLTVEAGASKHAA